jgi:hypothetical protein
MCGGCGGGFKSGHRRWWLLIFCFVVAVTRLLLLPFLTLKNVVVVIAVINFLENVPLYERQLFCFSKKYFEKNTNLSTIET